MQTKMPPELEGLCTGLDVWLTYQAKHTATPDTPEGQLEWAVKAALSSYDKTSLQAVEQYLGAILASPEAGRTLEELWMSLEPTRVFFSTRRNTSGEHPYFIIFNRVFAIIRDMVRAAAQ